MKLGSEAEALLDELGIDMDDVDDAFREVSLIVTKSMLVRGVGDKSKMDAFFAALLAGFAIDYLRRVRSMSEEDAIEMVTFGGRFVTSALSDMSDSSGIELPAPGGTKH